MDFADELHFIGLKFTEKSDYLESFIPELNIRLERATTAIFYIDILVFLLNKRKRTLHDYIGGTVVVKRKYLKQIEEHMELVNN